MIFQQFPIISAKISESYPKVMWTLSNVFQFFSKTGQDLQKGSEDVLT